MGAINKFLKSRQLYMLLILPFLIVALTVTSYYHPTSAPMMEQGGYLTFLNTLSPFWQLIIETVLLFGMVGMIFLINERFKLLQQTTTLPILLYLLLVAKGSVVSGVVPTLFASLIVAFALDRLQVAISNLKTNGAVFEFGVLTMVAVLICPKFILLLVWALCASLFSGRSTLKDISALLLGFIVPLFFLSFYHFWVGDLEIQPTIFLNNLSFGELMFHFSDWEWGYLGGLLFILCIALLHFFTHYSAFVLIHRRFFFALVFLLFFLAITFFVIPFDKGNLMNLFALPASFIYAQFFLTQRSALIGNLVFFLLLTACLLPFFI